MLLLNVCPLAEECGVCVVVFGGFLALADVVKVVALKHLCFEIRYPFFSFFCVVALSFALIDLWPSQELPTWAALGVQIRTRKHATALLT